jgi:hypothetical protein
MSEPIAESARVMTGFSLAPLSAQIAQLGIVGFTDTRDPQCVTKT